MITRFNGEYRWLSNFFRCFVLWDGMTWPSAEHAYQASKTFDYDLRQNICGLDSPGSAKMYGRALSLRPGWLADRDRIMLEILRSKFAYGSYLGEQLIKTVGHELVEQNHWHDTYWGKCVCDKHHGEGLNKLGEMLMQVRRELYRKRREGKYE